MHPFRNYYYELHLVRLIEKELLYLIEILKQKEMDASTIEATITTLETAITNDQTQLSKDQADLATAQAELAFVSLVNILEALTADQVATVNEGLQEASNTTGITLTLPTASQPAQ